MGVCVPVVNLEIIHFLTSFIVLAQTEGDTGYDYNDAYDYEYDHESGNVSCESVNLWFCLPLISILLLVYVLLFLLFIIVLDVCLALTRLIIIYTIVDNI